MKDMGEAAIGKGEEASQSGAVLFEVGVQDGIFMEI